MLASRIQQYIKGTAHYEQGRFISGKLAGVTVGAVDKHSLCGLQVPLGRFRTGPGLEQVLTERPRGLAACARLVPLPGTSSLFQNQ